ncbi:MAG: START domain-containing protein, partial [Desulfobacterales bacterium]|nr:START domain-containing protein [Desulfobacterales bacterium]
IPASPLTVYKVILDHATYENISEYIQTTEIMPSNEKNVWYIYQRLDLPVISDRDYTLRYCSIENPQKDYYQVLWEIANNKGPAKQKDVIRVTTCTGSLTIESENKDTTTRITYTLYTDPGGYIPDWLANIANQRSIPKLLRAIKDRSTSSRME